MKTTSNAMDKLVKRMGRALTEPMEAFEIGVGGPIPSNVFCRK